MWKKRSPRRHRHEYDALLMGGAMLSGLFQDMLLEDAGGDRTDALLMARAALPSGLKLRKRELEIVNMLSW